MGILMSHPTLSLRGSHARLHTNHRHPRSSLNRLYNDDLSIEGFCRVDQCGETAQH